MSNKFCYFFTKGLSLSQLTYLYSSRISMQYSGFKWNNKGPNMINLINKILLIIEITNQTQKHHSQLLVQWHVFL
jgi:hypothetical protein